MDKNKSKKNESSNEKIEKVLKVKKPKEFKLSEKYFKFLGKRTKIKDEEGRKKLTFKI